MIFLIDNQLPEALSRLFVSLGCDSIHVMEVGLGSAPDSEIWRCACENGRIVVTKDDDFLHLANRQPQAGGVIWVRLGNCRTAHLLARFQRLWPRIHASLSAGDRVIETAELRLRALSRHTEYRARSESVQLSKDFP